MTCAPPRRNALLAARPTGVLRTAAAAALLAAFAAACAQGGQRFIDAPPEVLERMVAADGTALPLRRWMPAGEPVAVIVALHGFTDHSGAFQQPSASWTRGGVALYAYDQRGFGRTDHPGLWPGSEVLADDMAAAAAFARARHPGVPLFLLGESMGAAVVLAASRRPDFPTVNGVILVAPAVWGFQTINPVAAHGLRFLARFLPAVGVPSSGPSGFASDNEAAREAMGRDPLVLHTVRLDTVGALVALMDAALDNASALRPPALVVHGARDGIIPGHAREELVRRLDPRVDVRRYPDGYHMLLRDLNAQVVIDDILLWVTAGP